MREVQQQAHTLLRLSSFSRNLNDPAVGFGTRAEFSRRGLGPRATAWLPGFIGPVPQPLWIRAHYSVVAAMLAHLGCNDNARPINSRWTVRPKSTTLGRLPGPVKSGWQCTGYNRRPPIASARARAVFRSEQRLNCQEIVTHVFV